MDAYTYMCTHTDTCPHSLLWYRHRHVPPPPPPPPHTHSHPPLTYSYSCFCGCFQCTGVLEQKSATWLEVCWWHYHCFSWWSNAKKSCSKSMGMASVKRLRDKSTHRLYFQLLQCCCCFCLFFTVFKIIIQPFWLYIKTVKVCLFGEMC